MHALTRKALFVLLSAVALFATGCRKKPTRPDPSATVIGQQGILNPNEMGAFGAGFTTDPNSLLTERGDPLDPANQIRGLLESVYFAFDQSAIAPNERPKLMAAKAHLDANPTQRLLIEGRADWRGTTEYNLGLGDRRAQAAKQFLVTLGVDPDRIETISKGDLEATENASEEVMARDRRAELIPLRR